MTTVALVLLLSAALAPLLVLVLRGVRRDPTVALAVLAAVLLARGRHRRSLRRRR